LNPARGTRAHQGEPSTNACSIQATFDLLEKSSVLRDCNVPESWTLHQLSVGLEAGRSPAVTDTLIRFAATALCLLRELQGPMVLNATSYNHEEQHISGNKSPLPITTCNSKPSNHVLQSLTLKGLLGLPLAKPSMLHHRAITAASIRQAVERVPVLLLFPTLWPFGDQLDPMASLFEHCCGS
jgi:hypothetical protein